MELFFHVKLEADLKKTGTLNRRKLQPELKQDPEQYKIKPDDQD